MGFEQKATKVTKGGPVRSGGVEKGRESADSLFGGPRLAWRAETGEGLRFLNFLNEGQSVSFIIRLRWKLDRR